MEMLSQDVDIFIFVRHTIHGNKGINPLGSKASSNHHRMIRILGGEDYILRKLPFFLHSKSSSKFTASKKAETRFIWPNCLVPIFNGPNYAFFVSMVGFKKVFPQCLVRKKNPA